MRWPVTPSAALPAATKPVPCDSKVPSARTTAMKTVASAIALLCGCAILPRKHDGSRQSEMLAGVVGGVRCAGLAMAGITAASSVARRIKLARELCRPPIAKGRTREAVAPQAQHICHIDICQIVFIDWLTAGPRTSPKDSCSLFEQFPRCRRHRAATDALTRSL